MLTRIIERRVDARPLALMRILVGSASLAIAIEACAVLAIAARPGTVAMPTFSWLPSVSSNFAVAVFLVWSIAAVMLALGYGSRASAALVAGCGVAALVAEQQAYSNHLMLMIALCLLLAVADSGATWSIEARRGGRRLEVPFWPIALLMVQITTLYAFTALSKLNSAFLAGETMALRSESSLALPLDDFAPWVVSAMAISAVCAEGFLAVGLWRPRLRPAAFTVGLTLHCGILVLLGPHLLPFAMLALSGYVLFLQPTRRVVVWHESCSSSRRWVRLFARLDWLGAHEFVSVQNGRPGLQVVADGVRYEGFDAVRVVLEACPATFLAAPVLRLPPLRAVGRRVYAKLAISRSGAIQPA